MNVVDKSELRPKKIEKCAKRLSNKSLSPSRASLLMLDDDLNLCGGFRMCHMFMDIGLRFPEVDRGRIIGKIEK
jgi:hypothetical protein